MPLRAGLRSTALFFSILIQACLEPHPQDRPDLISVTVTVNIRDAEPESTVPTVGFDQAHRIFTDPKYGPCTSCHQSEWPYLAADAAWAWPRFLEGAAAPQHQVSDKIELAARIIACSEPTDENHCAGDPSLSSDNSDYKMPAKFGYDLLTSADLQILKRWLADGVRELSSDGSAQARGPFAQVEAKLLAPPNARTKVTPPALALGGGDATHVTFTVSYTTPCVPLTVQLLFQNSVQQTTRFLQLSCKDQELQTSYALTL